MAEASRSYFDRLNRRQIDATTAEAILAEVVYVLTSGVLYDLAREDVRDKLRVLLQLNGWALPDRPTWLRALDLYRDWPRLSFPDCLALAHVEVKRLRAVISFDRALSRVPGIVREEP